ncbi:hypothetical protein DAEQUDRAFT_169039 [Daedalea quercina L-15889]|uniref:Uncharacterized protein n=1 Tax=Daedalea quercina L-15889 TaxID=1314783 RepID=A0A165RJV1_9APHY|nr:hypothetical protein DAEQUDRAFT_169039 [Daedalea quercina L-15889]
MHNVLVCRSSLHEPGVFPDAPWTGASLRMTTLHAHTVSRHYYYSWDSTSNWRACRRPCNEYRSRRSSRASKIYVCCLQYSPRLTHAVHLNPVGYCPTSQKFSWSSEDGASCIPSPSRLASYPASSPTLPYSRCARQSHPVLPPMYSVRTSVHDCPGTT